MYLERPDPPARTSKSWRPPSTSRSPLFLGLFMFLIGLSAGLLAPQYRMFFALTTVKTQALNGQQQHLQKTTGSASELQWQLAMSRARSPTIWGPMNPLKLSDTVQAQFRDYAMDFDLTHENPSFYLDERNGRSSVEQVPQLAVKHMKRNNGSWKKQWSSDLISELVGAVKAGEDISPPDYPGSGLQVLAALQDHVVGKVGGRSCRFLVGGSISPWVESIVLGATGAEADVSVADWQPIDTDDARIHFVSMPSLQSKAPDELYDVIISFSSIEHDGLGRYGDPINPNGDFAAMAEFYMLLKEGGVLILGIPVNGDQIDGKIMRNNDHRRYGKRRLAALERGFEVVNRIDPGTQQLATRFGKTFESIKVKQPWQFQPLFVLRKKRDECPIQLEEVLKCKESFSSKKSES